jgi:SAM-dependent methyltransferase
VKYEFSYEPHSPYGHLVDLLVEHVPVGTVIDLGCGHAAIAPPLAERGYHYVGVDVDAATIDALGARGVEAHRLDLTDTATLADGIVALAAGRRVVAITALDVVEHLPRPVEALRAVHDAMKRLDAKWLGVSIPNVAHVDLAGKLLAGRWDVTPTGLLDDTHVSLFTERRLGNDMRVAGFAPGPAKDFHLELSDQHFPTDLATLAPAAPLARLVRAVRAGADGHSTTNQFVRLFRRSEHLPSDDTVPLDDTVTLDDTVPLDDTATPFLTVVVRTRGTQPSLADTCTYLAEQTSTDFEVLLFVDTASDEEAAAAAAQLAPLRTELAVQVRTQRTSGRIDALNQAIGLAEGRYLAILDEDHEVLANWVEDFRGALDDAGAVLRSRAVVRGPGDDGSDQPTAGRFDLVQHLRESQTPIHTVALPISVFRDLGLRFDPEMPLYAELDVVLQAAQWCGVTDTEVVAAVHRRGDDASIIPEASHEWVAARARLVQRLDNRPMLLPEGSATRLLQLLDSSEPGHSNSGPRATEQVDTVAAARERVLASGDFRTALAREGMATRTAVLLEELAVQRDRADRAEAEVAAFERSRVWRATKPVRVVLQAQSVRGLGAKVKGLLRR